MEIDGLPPALSGLLSSEAEAADEGHYGASSYGSGEGSYGSDGQSGSDKDFKFVCINNNNNTVVGGGGEEEEPIPEPDLACEECFAANSTLQTRIEDFLEFDAVTTLIFFSEDGIGGIGEGFLIGTETDTIEQLCAQIENAVEELGVPLSDGLIELFFTRFLGDGFEDGIDTLIECLLEAGIIVHREPLFSMPQDSISANGIAGANSQCIGDPICESLLQAQMTNSNSLGSSTNINTDTSEFQGTVHSPTIAQGIEESSALEKITKLKKQWLDLLP